MTAAVALSGCGVGFARMDVVRGGVVSDREGVRGQVSTFNVEVGGPRAPSPQAISFTALHNIEFKDKWLRMGIAGQARLYAYRLLAPCVGGAECDVTIGGAGVKKDDPFHTVIKGKHGRPVDAIYLGKNNLEQATVGALLEGDLSMSGALLPGVDANGRKVDDWKASVDRPRALAGLFVTASPPLVWGMMRFGAEGGGQYDGVDIGWFGRVWVSMGITAAPSPRRVQDVPKPYVPAE